MTAFDLHREVAFRDAGEAWRFIRRFAEAHATALVAADGYDAEMLRAAEERLGFALPAALRAVYALFGRRDDLTRSQDRLLAPEQVHVDDAGEVMVFRVEHQHVAQWGVPLSAVTGADPPVVFRLESISPAGRTWQPFLERVSLAGVEMMLSEWLLSGDTFADNRDLDAAAVAVLERRFRRLPFPGYPCWAVPGGGPVRWFEGHGAVLREDAGTWLWVRAASADGLAAVRRALPGMWLMDEDPPS